MTKTFIFDSWALIAFIEKESPADLRVQEILEQSRRRQLRVVISIINLGEVYYRVGKMHGEKAADTTLAKLRLLPLEILPADEETVLTAARWKMKRSISYTRFRRRGFGCPQNHLADRRPGTVGIGR